MTDPPIPLYQKVIGAVLLLIVVGFIVFDWSRFTTDFWPPDNSRVGPNLVASVVQAAVILIVAALIWPPTRRRIHRFVDSKADSIKGHVTAEHEKAARERAELHRRLDHLIKHHPDIPDLPEETVKE